MNIPLLRLVAPLLVGVSLPAYAAYIYTGSAILENFDGLPAATSLPNVFSATVGSQTAISGTQFYGTKVSGNGNAATDLGVDDGSNNTGGIYSYGASGGSDRALGMLASNSDVMAFGFEVVNGSSNTVTEVDVALTVEFWRRSTSTQNFFNVETATTASGGSASNFLTATTGFSTQAAVAGPTPGGSSALNGNLPVNQAPYHLHLTGLSIAPGQSFFIRWTDTNDSGNDAGIALDQMVVTLVPEPVAPLLGGLGLLAGLRRRRR